MSEQWSPEQLKTYIEAMFREKDRALQMADHERELAANALRIELARAIEEGDARLREHIENQVAAIEAALIAAQRATDKFEVSVHDRFAQVNEFRAALDDLGKQMATRRETEAQMHNLAENIDKARNERQHQIEELRSTLQELRSRLDTGTDLRNLQARIDQTQGRTEGAKMTWGAMAGLLAAAATGLGIVIILANLYAN